MHPSGFFEDDDEEGPESYLPDGVTEEQVDALMTEVVEAIKKIGLYVDHAHLVVPETDDWGTPSLFLHGIFTFGKVAFTSRIQNPEQEKFDDDFKVIEKYETEATVADIVESFKRGPQETD